MRKMGNSVERFEIDDVKRTIGRMTLKQLQEILEAVSSRMEDQIETQASELEFYKDAAMKLD